MKHILAAEHLDLLERLSWTRVLLAFDFDGTLAPMVEDHDAAAMRVRTRELLARLCALCPCAVISGRSQADVWTRLRGTCVKHVIGNHGLEPGPSMGVFEREIARALPLLEATLAGVPGVEIEDKRYSLALHYRRSQSKRAARAAITRALETLPVAIRCIPGKLVVNVVPAGAPNKGDALLRLRAMEGADIAIYVGDDATDEDVFTIDQPGRLLTIRIGESMSSAAQYFLRGQREIELLLDRLLAAGKRSMRR